MAKKHTKISAKSTKQLLKDNPKVSKSVVAQYDKLKKELEKLGVDTKPRYTLSPPLGGAVSTLLQK